MENGEFLRRYAHLLYKKKMRCHSALTYHLFSMIFREIVRLYNICFPEIGCSVD